MKQVCLYSTSGKCIKGGIVDTDKDAYSLKTVSGRTIYWHYLCYTKNSDCIISLSHHSKEKLYKYLSELDSSDDWIEEVKTACA